MKILTERIDYSFDLIHRLIYSLLVNKIIYNLTPNIDMKGTFVVINDDQDKQDVFTWLDI